jgi:MFS transporter, DHA3 family, macrolide efflux protein
LIWLGQLVSILGSGLTQFGLEVLTYQRTDSAKAFSVLMVFNILPGLAIGPLAGALADRLDRRRAMVISNCLACVTTALAVFAGRGIRLAQIYSTVASLSALRAFLNLAYAPLVTELVPKEQYGRAAGLVQTSQAAGQIIPPLLGGMLMGIVPLPRIILIDAVTYIVAILSLMVVSTPSRQMHQSGRQSLLAESYQGWTYIVARPGLLLLLMYFALFNFVFGLAHVLFTPLVLTLGTPQALGLVSFSAGVGYLLGSIIMSIWGGPKQRIEGMLLFGMLFGLATIECGASPSVSAIAIGAFFLSLFLPVIAASSQAIWQRKTPVNLQGRVFAIRYLIAASTLPLGYAIAGPLLEGVVRKMSQALPAAMLGGPARPMRLMFVFSGVLALLIQVLAYCQSRFRLIEIELPDADCKGWQTGASA